MRMHFKMLQPKVFIHVLLILSLTACATAPPKAPEIQESGDYTYVKEYMTWLIQKEMKTKQIVGLSVALVDDQQIVWQQGFGWADRENKIAATPQTVYRAGSISKVFNAMAVMKLVEAGKMDIDRPLSTYLPEFTINSRFGDTDGITPRTIMTHHSGLPGHWLDGTCGKQPMPFTRLVQAIKDEYVAYPPNMVMSYSNIAVTLLGHAVQRVSGQPYARLLDQSLLKPMGMNDSRFEIGITDSMAAKAYDEAGKETIEYPLGDIPAGGLNTTAVDLAHLAMLVNNHGSMAGRRILDPQTLSRMFTPQNEDVPLDCGHKIGLAWGINDKVLNGWERVCRHGGATMAHRATFIVAPESKIGVVVLANSASTNTQKIAHKMLQTAWEAKTGKMLADAKETKTLAAQADTASDFKGTYASLLGKVDISEKSPHRYMVRSSERNFNLNREDDGRYHLSYRLWGFIRHNLDGLGQAKLKTADISGNHVIIADFGLHRSLFGVRVESRPIPEAWQKRLGVYQLLNPPEADIFEIKRFLLKIEDDYLVEEITGSDNDTFTKILRPVNATEAIVEGIGRNLGETVRIVNDDKGNEILTFSGMRFKPVDG